MLRAGIFEAVAVVKMDRWARSAQELSLEVSELYSKGVKFISLKENIDLGNAMGKFQFNMFAAFAEFERDLIRERTSVGREAAMKRGVKFGRPKKLSPEQKELILKLREEGKSATELAKTFNVDRSTIYRL